MIRLTPPRPPQPPLAPDERARVQAWRRRVIWFYTGATIVLIGPLVFAGRLGDSQTARHVVLGVLAVLLVAGAIIQFRERCPRCNARLGRQARLVVPQACKVCGVSFVE